MKKNFKEYITFTNIIVVLAIIVYILNDYVISPDTGSVAKEVMGSLSDQDPEMMPFYKVFFMILGTWGGHVNDIFNFQLDKVLSGEIWRNFTVVITHVHLPHIAMNMAALIIAGNHIEKRIGWKKTLLLFAILITVNNFLCDIILFKIMGFDAVTSEGASGWITTLMGMMLMRCILDKEYKKREIKTGEEVYLIIYFVSTTFLLGFNAFTFTAHMLGMIAGMITEWIMQTMIKPKQVVETL